MKKKAMVLILALICLSMFTGCFCQHEWVDANCAEPMTCSKCGETEGAPLGHVWMAATCTEPKTCEVCGVSEGQANGHTWSEATCTQAKTCSACHLTEGEALGHTWQDATTEQPKTCETCGATEGERIITDPRFTTASAAKLLGRWGGEMTLTGEAMGLEDFDGEVAFLFILDFGSAGELNMSVQLTNEAEFMDTIVRYTMDSVYAELAQQGLDKEAADAAMEEAYGMNVEEYVRALLGEIEFNQLLASVYASFQQDGVYYVDGNTLYAGDDWDSELEPTEFTLDGDKLVIDELRELCKDGVFTRIAE